MSANLTEYQVNQFKNLLMSRFGMLRYDLRRELLSCTDDHYHRLADALHDSEYDVPSDHLSDIDHSEIKQLVAAIKDIDSTLMRIKNGYFGLCIECELPIAFKRLLEHPTAKRCIICQRLYEKPAD